MTNDRDQELQRLVDTQAIVDVAIRYAWAIDSHDWAALEAVFTADATAKLGDSNHASRDEIVAKCSTVLTPLDTSQHMVSNHQVAVDGDDATHRCYFHAQHVRRGVDGGSLFVVAGIYDDTLRRTEVGWRITHRTLDVLWTSGNRDVVRP